MKLSKSLLFASILALAACGADTSTDLNTDTDKDDDDTELSVVATCPASGETECPADTTKDGTSCVMTGTDMVTVTGVVNDFQSERAVKNAVVNIVDNATGLPTGACTVAGADGKVTFSVPRGVKVGIATSSSSAKDTYQYHMVWPDQFMTGATAAADAFNRDFFSVSQITAQLIPGLIGVELDLTKGIVAGTVYKANGDAVDYADVEMRVRASAENEAFYFNNDSLPAARDSESQLNSANGLFVVFDVPTGTSQSLEFSYAGTVSATTDNTFVAFPDSVAISSIVCTLCE